MNQAFARFARKADVSDVTLCRAVRDIELGLVSAYLGGAIVKQRIARMGRGKSGGFRTLIAFKASSRAIFLHGFAKNKKDNIASDELAALKKLASEYLSYDEETIAQFVLNDKLFEVKCDQKAIP